MLPTDPITGDASPITGNPNGADDRCYCQSHMTRDWIAVARIVGLLLLVHAVFGIIEQKNSY